MEELVIVVLQIAGELLGTVLGNLPFVEGRHWRRTRRSQAAWRELGPTLASSRDTARRAAARPASHAPDDSGFDVFGGLLVGLAWLCAGLLVGGLVTLAWPHTFLPTASLRIANLVAAPIVAAILAEWLARRRADDDPDIDPRAHFWRAFWFTLGLTAARMVGAER